MVGRARRRAAVMIGLAGVLGGALVGLSSIDGVTATSPGHGSGSTGPASQSPSGTPSGGSTHSGSPTHKATSAPTRNATSAPTRNATSTPTHTPRFSPTPIGSPTPRGASTATPTPTPRTGSPVNSPTPKSGPTSTPTPHSGNTHNAKWPQDSRGWKDWNGGWQDPNWRREHSRDSRHERGFFRDRDRFCDTHDCDRFHFDEFRSEDSDFRHDCDILISFHSVRALLDFLDGDSSLRDFFELHGDLYDFLVNHSDWSDDFDPDCTLIDLRL
jgi:hypothetical protein